MVDDRPPRDRGPDGRVPNPGVRALGQANRDGAQDGKGLAGGPPALVDSGDVW